MERIGDSMNMFEILKSRLPNGLVVLSVKETHTKYKIEFEYEGIKATAELSKTCAPGYHNNVADHAIITTMSEIMIAKGDYVSAKEWLRKIQGG